MRVDVGLSCNLMLNFDNVPAGFSINPASITDLGKEFDLNYTGQNASKTGTGTIRLVTDEAPQRIGETNSYRYRIAGRGSARLHGDEPVSSFIRWLASVWSQKAGEQGRAQLDGGVARLLEA